MNYNLKIQENVSLLSVMDKMIAKQMPIDFCLSSINSCFSKAIVSERDFEERKLTINRYREQLNKLIQLPKVEQRSEEWYNIRKSLITASDFAQALGEGKFGTQKQIFQKKCGYEPEKNMSSFSLAPLKWGCMFEAVAQKIYSDRMGVFINEFGIIRHPTRTYFGASPDGISEHGIMLEIKCPYKRKITGEIPLQYYYQIQGQLDVCDLDECDYLECEFEEVQEYPEDYIYETGAIVEYPGDKFTYHYSKTELNDIKPGYVTIHYWKLIKYNVVRVFKDVEFVNAKLDALKEVWNKIEEYQSNKVIYDKEIAPQPKADKEKMNTETSNTTTTKPNTTVRLSGYSFI